MAINLTAGFLGDPAGWGTIAVQLWSVHGLWGGRIISVAGTGATIVRRVMPGAHHEQRYEFACSHVDVATLLGLLIEHDLLALELPERSKLVPDEVPTILTVRKGRRAFTLTTWTADPVDTGISAISAALDGLEQRTEGLQPLYDGPYQSGRDGT